MEFVPLFWGYESLNLIQVATVPGAKVVVAGAGFIGCEVAATARGLGCEVTNVAIDSTTSTQQSYVDINKKGVLTAPDWQSLNPKDWIFFPGSVRDQKE